jgi:hypothetical protein
LAKKKPSSLGRLADLLWGKRLQKWVGSPKWFRRFVIATVFCCLVFLLNALIDEIHPYNWWRLSYGAAATILMVGAALFGMRRRIPRMALRLGLGKAQPWLQFHIYGGTLFLLLTLMHSGFDMPKGILTWWLWVLSIWVTVSGIFGALLQKWIPKILTSGLANETLYERIPELIYEIRSRAEALIQTCTDPVKDFYSKKIAVAMLAPQRRLIYYLDITGGIQSRVKQFDYLRSVLSAEEREKLNKLESFYKTKLELDAHFTLQKILRWWLYTHVPVSLLLLILVGFHIFTILYY